MPRYRSAVSFSAIEVDLDDPDLGTLREAVKRSGLFVAHGDDFAYHAQFVRNVIDRYARSIDAAEALALTFRSLPAGQSVIEFSEAAPEDYVGASFDGTPIGIRFSRQITDLAAFCEAMFSSRAPFRLWGQPVLVDDVAFVEAVDLHVGQRLSVEVGRDWMRVYLDAGTCGNTIARLISNLQASFDGALSLTHPALQEAAALQPVSEVRA